MARSTRPSRRSSRKPSPAPRNTKKSSTNPTESTAPTAPTAPEKRQTVLEEWVEPPLRPPAPSFEDYKGGERLPVLQNMLPLGTLPPPPPPPPGNRGGNRRGRNNRGVNANQKTKVSRVPSPQEATASGEAPNANSGNTTEPNSKASSSTPQDHNQAQDEPATTTVSTPSAVETSAQPPTQTERQASVQTQASTQPQGPAPAQASEATSLAQTAPDRVRMRPVVNAAVSHATTNGHPQTGYAIQKMYEESRRRTDLLQILDAVLSDNATAEQSRAFRGYIESARRVRRSRESGNQNSSATSPTPASPSPVRRSLRPLRHPRPVNTEATDKKTKSTRAARGKNNAVDTNASESALPGGMGADQHHSARQSRSGSSSSSLSSLQSLVDDQEFAPSTGVPKQANADQLESEQAPKGTPGSSAPQLHTFSTTTEQSSLTKNNQKRTASAAGLVDESEEDRISGGKRQKLTPTFEEVEIKESGIRSSLSLEDPRTTQGSARMGSTESATSATQMSSNRKNGLKRPAPDDGDDPFSFPAPDRAGDLHASTSAATRRGSRADNNSNAQERPTKRAKTARIKMS